VAAETAVTAETAVATEAAATMAARGRMPTPVLRHQRQREGQRDERREDTEATHHYDYKPVSGCGKVNSIAPQAIGAEQLPSASFCSVASLWV
jgi:hypothetical protein